MSTFLTLPLHYSPAIRAKSHAEGCGLNIAVIKTEEIFYVLRLYCLDLEMLQSQLKASQALLRWSLMSVWAFLSLLNEASKVQCM